LACSFLRMCFNKPVTKELPYLWSQERYLRNMSQCVYMYVNVYTCNFLCMCVHMYLCKFVFMCVCVCMYVCR
jgi:hypothetical protein